MRERYLPLMATITVFVALFVTGGLLYKTFLLDAGARPHPRRQRLHHHRRDRHDLRHPFRRHRPFHRLDDRLRRRRHGEPGHHGLASARIRRVDAGLRPDVRRLPGLHHRFLRNPAVHHHARRPVHAARRLLHGHPGFDADQTPVRRALSPERTFLCRAAASWPVPPSSCSWFSRSPSSSPTSRASAPTSTPSAATAPRRS